MNLDTAAAAVTIVIRDSNGGSVSQLFAVQPNQVAALESDNVAGTSFWCEVSLISTQAGNQRVSFSILDQFNLTGQASTLATVSGSKAGSAMNGIVYTPSLPEIGSDLVQCSVANTSTSSLAVTITLKKDDGTVDVQQTFNVGPKLTATLVGTGYPARCEATSASPNSLRVVISMHSSNPATNGDSLDAVSAF